MLTQTGSQSSLSGMADGGAAQPPRSCYQPLKIHGQNMPFPRRWLERCMSRRSIGKVRFVIVKADAVTNSGSDPIAPLQPESPHGQFLVQLLRSHPHLFSAAAEQQLEQLAEDRDATLQQDSPTTGSESLLYKRIAECKDKERRRSVEEILYAIVSQRFIEAGILMVASIPSQRADNALMQHDTEYSNVHSTEAFEMIQEHLVLVLGDKGASDPLVENIMVEIGKMHIGQVYAASVLYGYFIRRVDQRFQLEKTMKDFSKTTVEQETFRLVQSTLDRILPDDTSLAEAVAAVSAMMAIAGLDATMGSTQKVSLLRNYVLSFDASTLHRYATIRSNETSSIIEKHTEALFGKPEVEITPDGSMAFIKDELLMLSLLDLRRLILEAAALGSFLWDAETYVDARYNIVAH